MKIFELKIELKPFVLGATKKICELKFFVENFSKSYFINYQKYSKTEFKYNV